MRHVQVVGTGMGTGNRTIPNAYFDEQLGTNVSDWLEENVEIFERTWVDEDQSTLTLCEDAAHDALERAGLEASDLDLVVVATDTPEFLSPATASALVHEIGAGHAACFDVNAACAGFVTACDLATKYLRAEPEYTNALVIGAYAMSRHLDMEDKKTVTLFADGAGAVVLQATEDADAGNVLATSLRTEAQFYEWMGIYGGGAASPVDEEVLEEKAHKLRFVKRFPSNLNPDRWSAMARELTEKAGFEGGLDAVDHYFFTQINIRSIRETMERLGQPADKAPTIMHHYGYTGSACIPMALAIADRDGKLDKGDTRCSSPAGAASTSPGWRSGSEYPTIKAHHPTPAPLQEESASALLAPHCVWRGPLQAHPRLVPRPAPRLARRPPLAWASPLGCRGAMRHHHRGLPRGLPAHPLAARGSRVRDPPQVRRPQGSREARGSAR